MRGFLIGTTLWLCGCAYVGDPLPPALNIPERITDLRTVQRGDRLLIDFTIPQLTTEGLPIRKLGSVDLRVGSATVPVEAMPGSVRATVPAGNLYGQDVTIKVRLLNSNGRASEWSDPVTIAVVPPLPSPAELAAVPHPRGIAVSWKAPARDRIQFRVFRRTADEKEPAVIATVDRPEFIDAAVEFGKSYSYSIQSFLGSAESEPAPSVSAVARDVLAPAVPVGLNAVTSVSSIELGWERNAEPDVAHYRVYRAQAGGEFSVLAEKVDNPAFSDKQVTSGTTYRYTVSAVDQAGNEGERTAPIQAVAP